MSIFSREKDKAEVEKAKEPAGTFFSNSSQSDAAVTKQQYSKVEEAGHVFGYNPDLELQTQIGGSSREYGQAAANASAANSNEQPTSRPRIGHAARTRPQEGHDNRLLFSTHRAALGIGTGPTEKERETLVEAAERKAYAGLMHILDLFAR
jgi:hypothetical protein